MATVKEASDKDDAEEKVLAKTICKFQSLKKELFELSQPIDEILERINQHEQERVDKLYHLKHEREQQLQTVQRLMEVESELKRENEALKHEREEQQQTVQRLMEVESELKSQLLNVNDYIDYLNGNSIRTAV